MKLKNQFELDEEIKNTMHYYSSPISASEQLKTKIDTQIKATQKEECFMKSNFKKVAVVAASICLLSGITVFASGKIVNLISVSSTTPEYTKFDDVKKASKQLGYPIRLVEQFTNGYSFSDIHVQQLSSLDESGKVIENNKGLDINYTNESLGNISLSISKLLSEEGRKPDQVKQYNDIMLSYCVDTYKFVPADYQLTKEDKENEKKDNYFISYGSDKVEVKQYSYVAWVENDISYSLMAFDTTLNSEQFFDMAQEILESNEIK